MVRSTGLLIRRFMKSLRKRVVLTVVTPGLVGVER